MNQHDQTADGFLLALNLIGNLGIAYDRRAVIQRLIEVANGQTTVLNSPQEEIAEVESSRGPLSDAQRSSFLDWLTRRRMRMDQSNREIANRVLDCLRREGIV